MRVLWWIPLVLALVTGIAFADETTDQVLAELIGPIEARLQEAKKLGAPKHCPRTYEAAVAALQAAESAVLVDPSGAKRGMTAMLLEAANIQATRVMSRISFIRELREERHGWEATVVHYDRMVEAVTMIHGMVLPSELTGPAAGRAVVDSLSRRRAASRALIDSLTFSNRDLSAWVETEKATRDTQIVRLQEELTNLRHRLWESELRTGMAEADAGEAKHRARREIERREQVRALESLFTAEEGVVMMTPAGDVRARLSGLKFNSGSAWLNPNYDPLIDKLVRFVETFPNGVVTVEGHTDDTGERAANLELSAERARRVAAALTEKLAWPPESLGVIGVGPDQPVAPNSSAVGRALNRRIEVLIEAPRSSSGDSP